MSKVDKFIKLFINILISVTYSHLRKKHHNLVYKYEHSKLKINHLCV